MKRLTLLATIGLLAACDSATGPVAPAPAVAGPSAAVVRNTRTEVATYAINDCSGEAIAVTVTYHTLLAVTVTPEGSYHVTIHQNIEGSGTGADGTEYVVSQVHNNEYTVAAGVEQTEVLHFNLVSKGSTPNELLQSTFHITITPDGDVSTWQDNFTIKCDL